MPSDLTDYARDLLARALCGRGPVLPSAAFAALGTGGDAATGVTGEPAGAGYARQRVVFAGAGTQANAEALRFAFAAAPPATLTHLGLFDAASGGNALTVSALSAPATLAGPGVVTVAPGALTVAPD